MWENMKFKSERGSGAYLAAYFVLTVGMVCGTLGALFLFPGEPQVAWYVLGVACGALLLSLLLRRISLPSTTWMGIFGPRRRELYDDYTPRRRMPRSLEYGTNLPPTVEDIREAADGLNNWVPHSSPTGRRSVRKQ